MYRTTRTVVAGLALAVVAGCDDPTSPRAPGPAAARTAGTPTAYAGSATRIELGWTDDSPNESGWEVHRSTTGADGAYTLRATLGANAASYTDAGLAPLTEYCYRVRSFRIVSRRTMDGELQGPACATTLGPPPAPTLLGAAPVPYGQVNVTWSLASTTNQGVRVERAASADGSWAAIASLPWWATSHADQGRAAEQLACYRVYAFNAYGDSPPSNVRCTAPPKPPAIRNAVATSTSSIDVTWADSSAVEDGYELQRARDDFAWSTIATLPANATTHTDAALVENMRYFYRVRAMRDLGWSAFSAAVSAATAATVPSAVTSITTSPSSSTTIAINMGPVPTLADWARIERSTDGTTWTPVDSVASTPYGSAIEDSGLVAERRVCHRAVATNRAGEAPPSPIACTVPPAAPTQVTMRTLADGSVEYAWTDNSSVEDGYELWMCVYEEGYYDPYCFPVMLPADTTAYRASSAEQFASVRAARDGGGSDYVWEIVDASTNALSANAARTARVDANAARTLPTRNPIRRTP
jgi:hypothetical protein